MLGFIGPRLQLHQCPWSNDLIYILANGAASSGFIIDEEITKVFKRELTDFAMEFGSEGATRFVTVNVKVSLISSLLLFHVSDSW